MEIGVDGAPLGCSWGSGLAEVVPTPGQIHMVVTSRLRSFKIACCCSYRESHAKDFSLQEKLLGGSER